jgi:hypothetical protein
MTSAVKHAEDCACRTCKRRRNEPERARCDCCGRHRLCVQETRDALDGPRTWDPHYCVKECLGLTGPQRAARRREADDARRAKRRDEPPIAFPVVGGPLGGKHAVPADFWSESGKPGDKWYRPPGRYAEHGREYDEYNAARGGHRRVGGAPTMIFVHRPLAGKLIRGRDR